jgi:hypothetical protein
LIGWFVWHSQLLQDLMSLTLLLLPIPNLGKPLLRPWSITQALQTFWLDIYPHRVQTPLVGKWTDSLTPTDSPEWMISSITEGRIDSKSLKKWFATRNITLIVITFLHYFFLNWDQNTIMLKIFTVHQKGDQVW